MFKRMISIAAVAGLVLALGTSANAAMVCNVNVGKGTDPGAAYELTTADNYQGAAPENTANSYWNNAWVNGGQTLTDMKDSQGNATSVDFTFNGMTGSQGFADGKLFASYAMWQNPQSFSFTDLNPSLTYDLVVYSNCAWHQEGSKASLTQTAGTGLTGTFHINSNGTAYGVGVYVEDTNPADVGGASNGNYARFNGLTPDGTGTIGFSKAAATQMISGFQLIEIPEPATMAVLGLGGLGVLLRRRKK